MDRLELVYEAFPGEALERFIEDGVVNHNFAVTGMAEFFPVGFFLRNDRGEWLGGLTGFTWGGWLQIRFLWVASAWRSHGNGSRLMNAAEAFAVEHDCAHATLETHSFQALGFYRNRGYVVVGQLDDYPPGHTKYFLRKALNTQTGSSPSP